jgi:hypothetical protein
MISLFTLIVVFSLGFASVMSQDVFAASPISSAVANDPDDGDTIYSVDDTITITFPDATNATASGTMSNTEFRANFTIATTDIDTADTVTGTWDGTSTILTLVINTIAGGDPPRVNTDTVNYDATNGNLFYAVNATVGGGGTEFLADTVTLTGDFGLFVAASTSNNGGGCSGDCEEPTLGVNSIGTRLVDNGFTYNGKSIDVERYFTPYPLVTVNVGKQNVAEFKIYENGGPDKISHFELAFGLANGESIGTSKAVINWDKSFDGVETVTFYDPENVLEGIVISTSEGSCSDESQQQCLLVTVIHTFRAPLDFNILGTNVWDVKRNAWQNYYNHGIEIVGESLNPPKEYDGISKGHIYHLTETGKTTAVDEYGNTWSLKHDSWMMDYILPDKLQDLQTMVMTRTHSDFAEYKTSQGNNAISYLLEFCPSCLKQYDDFDDSFSYDYPEILDKMSDPAIQKLMSKEELKAKKHLMQVFEQIYPGMVFD